MDSGAAARGGLHSGIKHGSWGNTQTDDGNRFPSAELVVALDPEKAALRYLLCRSPGAVRVVEAGASFEVSVCRP